MCDMSNAYKTESFKLKEVNKQINKQTNHLSKSWPALLSNGLKANKANCQRTEETQKNLFIHN